MAIAVGVRTPIGCFGGVLKDVPVGRLGAVVLNQAITKAGLLPRQVDEVIMGQAYHNGECANAARFALLEDGWPEEVPALVLDRRCCSGLGPMSQSELYLPGTIRWGLGGRVDEK